MGQAPVHPQTTAAAMGFAFVARASRELSPEDLLAVAAGMIRDTSTPAFLVDTDGTIRAWNTAACEFFGIPAWQATAHSCSLVVRGCQDGGEPLCTRKCSQLQAFRRGQAMESMEMVVRTGRLPSSRRSAIVHHLPLTHPDAGPVAVLHLLFPV